jgi:hypothetical protein
MTWLNRLFRRSRTQPLPDSMTNLRRRDPCWCGSGKRYVRCHRKEDRQRMRDLRIDKVRRNPFV